MSSNEQVIGFGRGDFSLAGRGNLNGPRRSRLTIRGGPLINVDPRQALSDFRPTSAPATRTSWRRGPFRTRSTSAVFRASGRVTGDDLADLYDLTGVATARIRRPTIVTARLEPPSATLPT